jgi:hypothetical protein
VPISPYRKRALPSYLMAAVLHSLADERFTVESDNRCVPIDPKSSPIRYRFTARRKGIDNRTALFDKLIQAHNEINLL